MDSRFSAGTFVWGLVLTGAGGGLAAVGFGWWDITAIDLRYLAPVLVILAGAALLVAALVQGRWRSSQVDRTG